LLLSREAASILVPLGTPSPDAGTLSPDSAHLIITWPSGVGSRIIGVAVLADGSKESRFIEACSFPVENGRGNHARRSRTVREPAEAFRLLDEDDGRYDRIVHFALQVNGGARFDIASSEGAFWGVAGFRPVGVPNAVALQRNPAQGQVTRLPPPPSRFPPWRLPPQASTRKPVQNARLARAT
jgi:hypothetical protein